MITAKKSESHNIVLHGKIIKAIICNFREKLPIQGQGCQLLSKFSDNVDYIIIINPAHIIQAQNFEVLATISNKSDCIPT
jgi:hypothetical protein